MTRLCTSDGFGLDCGSQTFQFA